MTELNYLTEKKSFVRTHGLSSSPVYSCWNKIVQLCNNVNNHQYHNYGGRGITVCDRWLKFENFYADMGDRPKGMVLSRKNKYKNYSKSNCLWITKSQQRTNQRVRKNSISGVKGVNLLKSGKWTARIKFNYKNYHLGHFEKIESAVQARLDAEVKYHGRILNQEFQNV